MQTPNLSIEQVELIRRLRNSGASLHQITEAYQVFERLDNELGSFGMVKVNQSVQLLSNSSNHVSTQHSNVHQNCQSQKPVDYNHYERKGNAPPPSSNCVPAQPLQLVHRHVQNHPKVLVPQGREGANTNMYQSSSFSDVLKEVASNAKLSLPRKVDGRFEGVNSDHSRLLNESPSINAQVKTEQCTSSSSFDSAFINHNFNDIESSPSISSSSSFPETCNISDNLNGSGTNDFRTSLAPRPSESAVREAGRCMLLSANIDQVKALIRKCSMSVPLFDPCQLTSLYGLSDVDINKFLNGFIPHDGEYGLQIVDWFINILSKTDWFVNDVLKYSQQIMMPKLLETPDIVDFTPRRERFTFREMHLEVLDNHFKKDHYPSLKEKEMIANECNIKMAIASNCELKEKERVTHINVDHWFRNKRKEIIRRARLEKVDATKVVLPSRVKSSKLLLHEPLGSDNSTELQGHHSPNTSTGTTQHHGINTSMQSGDADQIVSSHGDGINQNTQEILDYSTSAPTNGMNLSAPAESTDKFHSTDKQLASEPSEKCHSTDQQSSNQEKWPMEIQMEKEANQDEISGELRIDIKTEPVSEGENNG